MYFKANKKKKKKEERRKKGNDVKCPSVMDA